MNVKGALRSLVSRVFTTEYDRHVVLATFSRSARRTAGLSSGQGMRRSCALVPVDQAAIRRLLQRVDQQLRPAHPALAARQTARSDGNPGETAWYSRDRPMFLSAKRWHRGCRGGGVDQTTRMCSKRPVMTGVLTHAAARHAPAARSLANGRPPNYIGLPQFASLAPGTSQGTGLSATTPAPATKTPHLWNHGQHCPARGSPGW